LALIIIAIDPAVTANEDSDDTGIVVIGLGVDGHGYVLRDLTCHLLATEYVATARRPAVVCFPSDDHRILRQLRPRIHCQCDPVVAGMKNNFPELNVKLLSALDPGDRTRRRDTSVAFGSSAGARFLRIAELILDNPRFRLDQSKMTFRRKAPTAPSLSNKKKRRPVSS
jgi:hypothetical protein